MSFLTFWEKKLNPNIDRALRLSYSLNPIIASNLQRKGTNQKKDSHDQTQSKEVVFCDSTLLHFYPRLIYQTSAIKRQEEGFRKVKDPPEETQLAFL